MLAPSSTAPTSPAAAACWRATPRRAGCTTSCSRAKVRSDRTGGGSSSGCRRWGPPSCERRWQQGPPPAARKRGQLQRLRRPARASTAPGACRRCRCSSAPRSGRRVAEGVAQRARLLDLLLADLYGPQRALGEGWLPPELIFTHPNFLRPVHGLRLPRTCWLPLYGVDLVRAADGRWRALADRTQAPSGAGYALENRIIVVPGAARPVPELQRRAPGALLPGPAGDAGRAGPLQPRQPPGRAAHARVPTTPPTSSRPTWPSTSATPWPAAAISPSATTASTSRRCRACSRWTSSSGG